MSIWSIIGDFDYFLLEIFIFFRALSDSMTTYTLRVLVQDKICLHRYNETAQFCENIHQPQANITLAQVKNHILAESTQFQNYQNLLDCIPMVLWSLFIGSFLDIYGITGTKLVLLFGVGGNMFANAIYAANVYFYHSSVYLVLIESINVWFCGGLTSYLTTTYSYIAANSGERNRTIKFTLVRVCTFIGKSVGTFMGGAVLRMHLRADPQIRTYYYDFGLSLIINGLLVAVLLTLFWLVQVKKRSQFCSPQNDSINNCENHDEDQIKQKSEANKLEEGVAAEEEITSEELTENEKRKTNLSQLFRILINMENFRQTLRCMAARRPGRVRAQIHLLYLVLFAEVLISFGVEDVFLQFCEKVYGWNATMYADWSSISKMTSTTLLFVFSYFLVHRWRLADETIICCALISTFLAHLIVGTFLGPISFYVSIPVGSLAGFVLISIRSRLSKLVSTHEIGKILSLSSTLEAILPFLASAIYSNLFAVSIAVYPSFIFHFSAFVALISFVLMIFEQFG